MGQDRGRLRCEILECKSLRSQVVSGITLVVAIKRNLHLFLF